jgi:phosphate transport system substrate-binding protein
VLAVVVGCHTQPSDSSNQSHFKLLADTAVGGLSEALVNAFEAGAPDQVVQLQQASRTDILKALNTGGADAALIMYPPKDGRTFSTPIGFDTIGFITSPDVTVDNLKQEDIQSILSGRATRWTDFGGPDITIQVFVTPSGSSERLVIESSLMRGQPIGSSARVFADVRSLIQKVATTPGAIGLAAANELKSDSKSIAIDGIRPPGRGSSTNAYLLTTTVEFASNQLPHGQAQTFLTWVLGRAGQEVVRQFMIGSN